MPPSGMPTLGQQPHNPQNAILQSLQELSLEIYCRVAAEQITRDDQIADIERLQQLARDSHVAAKAFFQGLGVAQ